MKLGISIGYTGSEVKLPVDFVLEGLYATKKISRSEERGYHGTEPTARKPAREMSLDDEPRVPSGGGRKKYYN